MSIFPKEMRTLTKVSRAYSNLSRSFAAATDAVRKFTAAWNRLPKEVRDAVWEQSVRDELKARKVTG